MLEAGDADAIAFDRSLLPQIEGLPGIEIVDDLPNLLVLSTYLQFCVQADPNANPYLGSGRLDGGGIPPDFFADADLRKAFAYSFNYAVFIKAVLKGHGVRRSSVFPDGMVAEGPRRPAYDFDPASARAHFEKARGGEVWKQGFRLSLVMPKGNAVFESAAQMLKGSVESLNPKFQIDLQTLDLSIFSGVSGVKAPLVLTGSYVEVAEPDAFAMRFLRSNPQRPCVHAGDEIDRLIDEAAASASREEKNRLYGELIDQANAEVPLVPIASFSRFRVQRSWVKGWKYNPLMPLKTELFYTIYKSEAPSNSGKSEPSSRP
jgi:peptide/nickel transport system substrate-binding protein